MKKQPCKNHEWREVNKYETNWGDIVLQLYCRKCKEYKIKKEKIN